MRGKLVLLVGIGIGYVLGARAGRERYEEIKRAVRGFWNDPRVQHQVEKVEDFAKDKAPEVVDFLGDTAKKAVQRTSPARKTTTSATNRTAPKASGASKK
nr:small hypothetical protein Hyp1 [uncultured bacterium]